MAGPEKDQLNFEAGDLDSVLDGLERGPRDTATAPEAELGTAGRGEPDTPDRPPDLTPPPRMRSIELPAFNKELAALPADPNKYVGRTGFPDLFLSESSSTAVVPVGPEEKVEYFREKLKRTENRLAKIKAAWEVRERELDLVEELIKQARYRLDSQSEVTQEQTRRGDELEQKLRVLQQFIEEKKTEFEAYARKATEALAHREEAEKQVRAQMARLTAEFDAERKILKGHLEESEACIQKQAAELAAMRQLADSHKEIIDDQEQRLLIEAERALTGEEAIEERDNRLQQLVDRAKMLADRVKELQSEAAERTRVNEELERAVTQLMRQSQLGEARIAKLEAELEIRNAALEEAVGQVTAAEEELMKYQRAAGTRSSQLEEALSDLAAENRSIERDRQALEESKIEAEEQLRNVSERLQEVAEALKDEQARSEALSNELFEARFVRAGGAPSGDEIDRILEALQVGDFLIAELERHDAALGARQGTGDGPLHENLQRLDRVARLVRGIIAPYARID